MPDTSGLLCVDGLQHAFLVTAWEAVGAQSHWAAELLCPTCGTSIVRPTGGDGDWRWIAPEPDEGD